MTTAYCEQTDLQEYDVSMSTDWGDKRNWAAHGAFVTERSNKEYTVPYVTYKSSSSCMDGCMTSDVNCGITKRSGQQYVSHSQWRHRASLDDHVHLTYIWRYRHTVRVVYRLTLVHLRAAALHCTLKLTTEYAVHGNSVEMLLSQIFLLQNVSNC